MLGDVQLAYRDVPAARRYLDLALEQANSLPAGAERDILVGEITKNIGALPQESSTDAADRARSLNDPGPAARVASFKRDLRTASAQHNAI